MKRFDLTNINYFNKYSTVNVRKIVIRSRIVGMCKWEMSSLSWCHTCGKGIVIKWTIGTPRSKNGRSENVPQKKIEFIKLLLIAWINNSMNLCEREREREWENTIIINVRIRKFFSLKVSGSIGTKSKWFSKERNQLSMNKWV